MEMEPLTDLFHVCIYRIANYLLKRQNFTI